MNYKFKLKPIKTQYAPKRINFSNLPYIKLLAIQFFYTMFD